MTVPARGVVAAAVSADRRPAQHSLDAPAHAVGRLRLLLPDRLEHPHHVRGRDVRDRHAADDWRGVGFECARPLVGMVERFPAGAVLRMYFSAAWSNVITAALAARFCAIIALRCPIGSMPCLDQLAIFAGGVARFRQRHVIERAKAHVAALAALESVAENPRTPRRLPLAPTETCKYRLPPSLCRPGPRSCSSPAAVRWRRRARPALWLALRAPLWHPHTPIVLTASAEVPPWLLRLRRRARTRRQRAQLDALLRVGNQSALVLVGLVLVANVRLRGCPAGHPSLYPYCSANATTHRHPSTTIYFLKVAVYRGFQPPATAHNW